MTHGGFGKTCGGQGFANRLVKARYTNTNGVRAVIPATARIQGWGAVGSRERGSDDAGSGHARDGGDHVRVRGKDGLGHEEAFRQSWEKRDWPASVRGCFTICMSTEKGTVAMWAPALAAMTQCWACLMLAASTLVWMLWTL